MWNRSVREIRTHTRSKHSRYDLKASPINTSILVVEYSSRGYVTMQDRKGLLESGVLSTFVEDWLEISTEIIINHMQRSRSVKQKERVLFAKAIWSQSITNTSILVIEHSSWGSLTVHDHKGSLKSGLFVEDWLGRIWGLRYYRKSSTNYNEENVWLCRGNLYLSWLPMAVM